MYQTLKSSTLNHIKRYQELIAEYNKKIAYFDNKLLNEEMSNIKRQCYVELRAVCVKEQKECRDKLRKLVNGEV